MIKIYNAANSFEADQILALFEDNGISCYKQGVGAGSYMATVGLPNSAGFDILVHEEDVEKAKELLKVLVPETDESEDGEAESASGGMAKKAVRIVACTVLVIAIGAILLSVML